MRVGVTAGPRDPRRSGFGVSPAGRARRGPPNPALSAPAETPAPNPPPRPRECVSARGTSPHTEKNHSEKTHGKVKKNGARGEVRAPSGGSPSAVDTRSDFESGHSVRQGGGCAHNESPRPGSPPPPRCRQGPKPRGSQAGAGDRSPPRSDASATPRTSARRRRSAHPELTLEAEAPPPGVTRSPRVRRAPGSPGVVPLPRASAIPVSSDVACFQSRR